MRFSTLGLFIATLSLSSAPALADTTHACRVSGSFGYVYNGTTYTSAGPLPLTETGIFTIDNRANLSGEGTLAFQFANFNGKGPVWLLLREVQSNGVVTQDTNNPCTGTVDFAATATVIQTSNPNIVPEGTVLFNDAPRSLAYTVSGQKSEILDFISASPGTIASGTAHKQENSREK